MNFKTYLQQAVLPAAPHDLQGAGYARRFSKWFFEFVTNVMIVGALKYIADVSSSPILDGLYWVALAFLLHYVYSVTAMSFELRPFTPFGNNMATRILDHAFNFGTTVTLFMFAVGAIYVGTTEIAKLQG